MSGLGHTFVKPASRLLDGRFVIVTKRYTWVLLRGFAEGFCPALSGLFEFLPSSDLVSEGTGRDAKLSGSFGLIALETLDP